MATPEQTKIPRPFIIRRLHSLMGLWLVIFLAEHLLVNSQMALYFRDHGSGFISMVNEIHNLPYLPVIEILFLAIPFLIHGIWGMLYAWQSKSNARKTKGDTPSLPQYKRNRAYSWQRITSWILIVGILAHVIQMRFMDAPDIIYEGENRSYVIELPFSHALPKVTETLGVKMGEVKEGRVELVAPSAGAATFLTVRQAFTNPLLVILYSLLVITATYHAFNGLWTLIISWGITISRRSQKIMRAITTTLMSVVMFLGLISAWGTYWTTLIQS